MESAAVSSPDLSRGHVVKAFIVLSPDYRSRLKQSPDYSADLILELQYHVKSMTAPYKYPRKIEFVEELPKTVSGKIRRNELRKREQMKLVFEFSAIIVIFETNLKKSQ